jgi:outer membrane protein
MLKVFRVLGIGLAMVLSSHAMAEIKIGFVNVAAVLAQAPQAKKSKETLEKEFSSREKELIDLQKKLVEMEKAYQKDAAVMSSSRRKEKEQGILKKRRLLQRLKRDFDEDLNLRRNEELQSLQLTVAKAIDEYAKNKGYDLIVNEGVVFASEQIDISRSILDALKKGK